MRTKIHINFFIRNYFSYYFSLFIISVVFFYFSFCTTFFYIRNLMLGFLCIFASLALQKYKSYDKGENNKSVV